MTTAELERILQIVEAADDSVEAMDKIKAEFPGTQSALEICQRIQTIDAERWELDNKLFEVTGKHYDEFMDGMRRLLAPK